MKSRLHEGLR